MAAAATIFLFTVQTGENDVLFTFSAIVVAICQNKNP
jgi:hypothetical protein